MILCNPNMGYAEEQQYSSIWIEFYLNFGINVVLWNYRGYGASTGVPSPTNLIKDVEVVYQWARDKTLTAVNGQKDIKIGVHGTSMGGVPASYLGRTGAVDFLFLDRTFKDLLSFPNEIN